MVRWKLQATVPISFMIFEDHIAYIFIKLFSNRCFEGVMRVEHLVAKTCDDGSGNVTHGTFHSSFLFIIINSR